MPEQKPGESEQVVGTPRAFLDALERRFGPIRWDLAANASNAVVDGGRFYGPGSAHGEDALVMPWWKLGGVQFLNPEFGQCAEFAAKACAEGRLGARVKMLVPASVSTDWWRESVHGQALALFIRPRLTFVGHDDAYPKDLALVAYGPWVAPGYDTWKWNATEAAAR
jgi:hypothetical protein